MCFEDYWEGPPYLACDYRKAFKIRRKLENEMAWVQGIYNYAAVIVGLQNAFRKRGQKREQYLEKPLDIFPLTKEELKMREQEEFEKMQKGLELLMEQQIAQKKSQKKSKKQKSK